MSAKRTGWSLKKSSTVWPLQDERQGCPARGVFYHSGLTANAVKRLAATPAADDDVDLGSTDETCARPPALADDPSLPDPPRIGAPDPSEPAASRCQQPAGPRDGLSVHLRNDAARLREYARRRRRRRRRWRRSDRRRNDRRR